MGVPAGFAQGSDPCPSGLTSIPDRWEGGQTGADPFVGQSRTSILSSVFDRMDSRRALQVVALNSDALAL